MPKPPPAEPQTRKTLILPDSLWEEVAEYRHTRRIGSEMEALRRLVRAGLKAEGEQERRRRARTRAGS